MEKPTAKLLFRIESVGPLSSPMNTSHQSPNQRGKVAITGKALLQWAEYLLGALWDEKDKSTGGKLKGRSCWSQFVISVPLGWHEPTELTAKLTVLLHGTPNCQTQDSWG